VEVFDKSVEYTADRGTSLERRIAVTKAQMQTILRCVVIAVACLYAIRGCEALISWGQNPGFEVLALIGSLARVVASGTGLYQLFKAYSTINK
jgi:hypothetical protein